MLTIRDLTKEEDLCEALQEMKWLKHLNNIVSHEMITPLNCLSKIIENIVESCE